MSRDRDNDLTEAPENTDVLERNLTELLTRAHEPPTMDPAARARILDNLKAKVAGDTGRESTSGDQPHKRETGSRKTGGWRWGWALGGAGLLAAAGLVLFLRTPEAPPAPQAVHDNAQAQPERIALDDGSELILRTGAAVTVTGPRSVRIDRGEVLFDVAKGETPFTVATEHGKVVVLGTRFVVDADEQKTLASVVRGVVRLENDHGRTTLRAGDQGELEPGQKPTRRSAPRLSHLLGWTKLAKRQEQDGATEPIRKGTLIARNPNWQITDYPLPLRDFTLDIHVEGGVARVAVDQTFFNAQPMQLEGVYRFPLPADAAISRLTMYVDGKRMESAVVERTRARRIYESIVHRRRDPALLEWMSGNEFKMRVFPLPGRQEKRIALSYTQNLQRLYDDTRIEVPIPEVDGPVDNVRYTVRLVDCAACEVHSTSHELAQSVDGADRVVSFARSGYELGDDLVLLVRDSRSRTEAASVSDLEIPAQIAHYDRPGTRYLQVRAQPVLSTNVDPELLKYAVDIESVAYPRAWYVLFDTSGSRSPRERKAQQYFIERLLGELDEGDYVNILAFDATVRPWSSRGVRVGDVDRRDVARFLREQSADGVGHTDLGLALSQVLATAEKRATADAEPNVVGRPQILYVGDGVVTAMAGDSGAVAQSLLASIAGKAMFVAAAIGDHIDEPLLGTLAEGTGGMLSVINPGDDLDWRAFDLVAALGTSRVVGIEAVFLDQDRRPIGGITAYPSARTVADGEEIDVIARYSTVDSRGVLGKPPIETPAYLELRAISGDSPWLATIPIALSDSGKKAAYLPRIWAKRRLDALLSEGAKQHRKEITKLGKRHFLMTPFTSLLVLENDAMYERFKVSRKRAPGWAEYRLPKRIDVVREPMGTSIAAAANPEAALVRSPRQLIRASSHLGYEGGWGTIGIGTYGTIGHGSGGGAITNATLKTMEAPREPMAADKLKEAANDQSRGDADGLVNEAEDSDDEAFADAQVTTDSLRQQPLRWSGRVSGNVAGGMGKSSSAGPRRSRRKRVDPLLGAGFGRGGLNLHSGWAGESYYGYYNSNALVPTALHYDTDWRLDDLTEHVPGLFQNSIDSALRTLRIANRGGSMRGSITDDARALLDKASQKASALHGSLDLVSNDGRRAVVDASGRFALEQTLDSGLLERVVYTGDWLYHLYPELGLASRRAAGDAQAVLYDHFLPFRLPEADKLARFYHVRARDQRIIELRIAPDRATPRVELELDDQLRVQAVVSVTGAGPGQVTVQIGYDGPTMVVARIPDTAAQRLIWRPFTGSAEGDRTTPASPLQALATVDETAWTVVDMPLRQPAYHSARLPKVAPKSADAKDSEKTPARADVPAAGTGPWRARMRQLLASQVALQQGSAAWQTLTEIRAHVDSLTPGELVLASGAVRYAKNRGAVRKLVGAADQPIAAYLLSAHQFQRRYNAKSFDALARRLAENGANTSLIAMLAKYRGTLTALSRSGSAQGQKRVLDFVATYPASPLAYIAAYSFASRWQWSARQRTVAVWDALIAGSWTTVAQFEAARSLSYGGDYDRAVERFEDLYARSLDLRVDNTVASAFRNSSRGQAGWRRFWLSWRRRMLDDNDPDKHAQVLRSAMETGERGDLELLIARVTQLSDTSPEQAEVLADVLLSLGRESAALAVIQPWLKPEAGERLDEQMALSLYTKAALIAERQGRFLNAAELAERAMDRRDEVELAALRAHYNWLMRLYIRAAQTQSGASRTAVIDRALATVSEWRSLDPENAAMDQLAAELLFTQGRPEEAWRYLSTIIERHPMEGGSFQQAAQVLETAGDTERAERLWQRAVAVDPTNPTWILRRAEALSALGRPEAARDLLHELSKRKWHQRFWSVKDQARRLERSLKRSLKRRSSRDATGG